ncbi:Pyocin-S1 [Pseudomonas fluorescens]|uniref:Pyocin-S1 n=2 Tax=Pseudomonas fluorescens TaxID=294 RepID=A0A5E7FI13_PSEFL|nr:Pyocin-S1 [Pseudomonas fluorescens]
MAGERALFEEQAKIKREAEKARKAKESAEIVARYKAIVAIFDSWEAARTSRPFPVSGSAATAGPVFTLAAGRLATGATTNFAVRTALQTAVAAVTTAGSAIIVGFAALLYPSTLGDGESRHLNVPLSDLVPDDLHSWSVSLSEYEPDSLHALSIPLSDLTPYNLEDLHAAARDNSRISLPIAVGARRVKNTTEFFVATANGTSVPGNLLVQLATFDPSLGVYRSYNPDAKSAGMTWTPIVRPNNASTVLPASQSNIAIYDGTTLTALEGRTDTFPEFDLYTFGGFITIFPSDSGLPPIFTMFKDRRDDPGVASGYGVPASASWLGAAATPQGALIPAHIADKLRGKEFSSFRGFRKAFWKAVGNDQVLSDQFSRLNKIDLRDGLAPSALPSEHVGKRKKFEIHHIKPVSEDGAVYDIDNLTVLTPKQHIELHSKEGAM